MFSFSMPTDAQFRIVGLLDAKVNKSKSMENPIIADHIRSNAQGRGFSVVENTKLPLVRSKNIIKVHVIGDMLNGDNFADLSTIQLRNSVLKIQNENRKFTQPPEFRKLQFRKVKKKFFF